MSEIVKEIIVRIVADGDEPLRICHDQSATTRAMLDEPTTSATPHLEDAAAIHARFPSGDTQNEVGFGHNFK